MNCDICETETEIDNAEKAAAIGELLGLQLSDLATICEPCVWLFERFERPPANAVVKPLRDLLNADLAALTEGVFFSPVKATSHIELIVTLKSLAAGSLTEEDTENCRRVVELLRPLA